MYREGRRKRSLPLRVNRGFLGPGEAHLSKKRRERRERETGKSTKKFPSKTGNLGEGRNLA